VLEALPGDHDSSLVVGRLALAKGDAEEAKRILEAGVRKHADRPAMQVELARARLALGDLEGAGGALSRAHRLAPGLAHLWLVSGELNIRAGDYPRAGRDLDDASALGGLDEKQLQRLAAGFLALGLDPSTEAVAERRAAAGR
jgi:predicted Zn-dependent protease